MSKKPTVLEKASGCGCLLVIVTSGAAYHFLGDFFGGLVLSSGLVIFFLISSFFGAVCAENEDVRRGSGCFSIVALIGGGFLTHYFFPDKMLIFFIFCGIYIFAILCGINYRKERLERGKRAAENFRKQIENQGVDLNNLDE